MRVQLACMMQERYVTSATRVPSLPISLGNYETPIYIYIYIAIGVLLMDPNRQGSCTVPQCRDVY
jgi:hypothetical protein